MSKQFFFFWGERKQTCSNFPVSKLRVGLILVSYEALFHFELHAKQWPVILLHVSGVHVINGNFICLGFVERI